MQRDRHDSRAGIERLAFRRRHEQTLDLLRNIRLSFQQQHRLTQRAIVHSYCPCSRECHLVTTIRFIIREDPCFLPTLLTRNSKSSLLDTVTADYTRLWIRKSEDRIVEHFTSTREVHTFYRQKPSGLPGFEEAANCFTCKGNYSSSSPSNPRSCKSWQRTQCRAQGTASRRLSGSA